MKLNRKTAKSTMIQKLKNLPIKIYSSPGGMYLGSFKRSFIEVVRLKTLKKIQTNDWKNK